MKKDFLSLPEAAAALGISRIAVFKKVRKGQLPALRIGRNWAIAAAALEAYRKSPSPRPAETRPPKPAPMKATEAPPRSDTEMSDMGWD